mmetsp:Transcript_7834/g.18256  ORF Transcript_7834/g.18256 Transcript_7834/m.18256 type:complete len:269 (+) Transcript_7834:1609-2415(+)
MTATSSDGARGSEMQPGVGSTSCVVGASKSLLPPGLAADAPRSLSEESASAAPFSCRAAASIFVPLTAMPAELTLGIGRASGEGGIPWGQPASACDPMAFDGSTPWLSAKWTSAGEGEDDRRWASDGCSSSDKGLSRDPSVAVVACALDTSTGSVTDLGAIGCTSSLRAPSLIKASRLASVSQGCCLKASALIRALGRLASRLSRRFCKSVDLRNMSKLAFGSKICSAISMAASEDSHLYHVSRPTLSLASISDLLSLSSDFSKFDCC